MDGKHSSSLNLGKLNTTFVDQSGQSPFFKLPFKVRREIYSYLFAETILHVEAVHPYVVGDQGIMICTELEAPYNDLRTAICEAKDYEAAPNGDVVRLKCCGGPSERIGKFVEIEKDAPCSRLFALYPCTSTKSFEAASACPPGYYDHLDCCATTAGPIHSIRRICRQAYTETASLARDALAHTALQFSDLEDLQAFSMLLTDDQREEIRHIRINLQRVHYLLPAWQYFCNVFATPWDRRSTKYLLDDDDDYPNHKAAISFHYNYSCHDLSDEDSARALASSWVVPNIHFEWKFRGSSWGTVFDLWNLRARLSLSVRFAIPQFLSRRKNGEIESLDENMWDDARGIVLSPGDEGHVRLAERKLVEDDGIQDLLAEKGKILAAVTVEERERFQKSYDTKFHYYWHEPHFDRDLRNWGPGWLGPLQKCQHFDSFDVDFYDEEGLRNSEGLQILRDGLKERFTGLGIGPHPFLLYTH